MWRYYDDIFKVIGIFAYFLLPFGLVMWVCYEKYDVDIDPILIGWGMVLLELALFVQILYWIGV